MLAACLADQPQSDNLAILRLQCAAHGFRLSAGVTLAPGGDDGALRPGGVRGGHTHPESARAGWTRTVA